MPDDDEVLRLYCDEEAGRSIAQTAREVGRSISFVRRVLRDHDIEIRPLKARPKKSTNPERDRRIIELFHVHGWSKARIAREVGLSDNRVGKIIELRDKEFRGKDGD